MCVLTTQDEHSREGLVGVNCQATVLLLFATSLGFRQGKGVKGLAAKAVGVIGEMGLDESDHDLKKK